MLSEKDNKISQLQSKLELMQEQISEKDEVINKLLLKNENLLNGYKVSLYSNLKTDGSKARQILVSS